MHSQIKLGFALPASTKANNLNQYPKFFGYFQNTAINCIHVYLKRPTAAPPGGSSPGPPGKVGDSDSEGFWTEFIASLKERGLTGVKLVISDAHGGLTKAIRRQLQGCVWQHRTERCAC